MTSWDWGPVTCILTTPPGDEMLNRSSQTFDLYYPYPQAIDTLVWLNTSENKCFGKTIESVNLLRLSN